MLLCGSPPLEVSGISWNSHSTCQHSWAGTQVGSFVLHCSVVFGDHLIPKLAKPSSRGLSMEWAQSAPSSDCNQKLLDKSVKLKIFLAVSIGRGKYAFCSFNEFIIQRPEVTKIADWLIRHNSRAIKLHKGHYVGILIKYLSSALIRRENVSRKIGG